MNAFVGRSAEIDAIAELFETHQLVTIVGPAGMGKSRLAGEFAARRGPSFGEGAFFVDLAPLGDFAMIPPAIAALLRPGVPVDGTDAESLAHAVGERSLLLVVDDCDRFVDATARVLSTFLHRCPNLRVLATCRGPLDVRDEYVYALPPLEPNEALRLFTRRAEIAGNGVTPGDVGGVPLAVELIAARATAEDIERLGRWRVPPGQAAHSAIEWSYEHGDDEERRVFRALGIFVGGFTAESASELGAEAKGSAESILAILARLERAALIERNGTRYRLLEQARVIALERLRDAGEYERVARRHAAVADRLAQRAYDRAYDMTREVWRAWLEPELPNVRAALVWSLDKRNDLQLATRIVGSLGMLWRDVGIPAEGLRRAQQLATLGEGDGRLWLTIAKIKSSLWMLPHEQLDAAVRAERMFEASGDVRGRIEALVRIGAANAYMRNTERMSASFDRAMRMAQAYGNRRLTAHVMYEAAVASAQCDLFEEAKRLWTEVTPLLRADEERRLSTFALLNLAETEFATGDPARAIECLIEVNRFGSDVIDQGSLKSNMAAYLVALDRRDEALESGREALRLMRLSEDRVRIVFLIQHLAAAYALEGDLQRAARLYGYTGAQYTAYDVELEFTERYTRDLLASALEPLGRERLDELVREGSIFSTERAAEEAIRT